MANLQGANVNRGMNNAEQEVAVVGGSAAGFFTAYLLARASCRVRVLERAEELDPTPRTLIVTSRMRDLLGAAGECSVVNEIRRFELFTDGRAATVRLERPDLIIERASLIRGLALQAQQAGARVELGRRFVSLESNGGGVWLDAEGEPAWARDQRPPDTRGGGRGAVWQVGPAARLAKQQTVTLIQ